MKITPTTIRTINGEISNALKAIEAKYGVKIELGNSSYTASNYRTKLTVSSVSADGVVQSPLAQNFERYRKIEGISASIKVGDTFRYNGKTFVLKGYDTKKRKYPIIAEYGGSTYKLPVSSLK